MCGYFFNKKINMNKKHLVIGLVLCMLIWGLSWPSSKILSTYATPLQLAAIRFILNTITVLGVLLFFKIQLKINTKGLLYLIPAALLLTLYNYLFFNGIKNGMPGAGGVLVTSITPLMTYLLGSVITKKKLTSLQIIGLTIGLCGGLILLQIWNNASHLLQSGNIYFLFCTITWAVLSRITSVASKFGSPIAFTFWMYAISTIILAGCVHWPTCYVILKNGDFKFWGNLLFNSCINAGGATLFFFYATSQIGASRTSSFTFIVPFSAAIFSYIFFKEILTWPTIVGGALGLIAVYIINLHSINNKMMGK
jgi:drug/metabolite transporter (DMT)-like permease